MLSALYASDPFLSNPFSTLDGGFTPWECPEFLLPEPTSPKTVTSSTGSDDPSQTPDEKEKPASDDSNRVRSIMEERKRRRMISNRESARRSRMRKQRHLDNLRNQLNLFRVENREMKTWLQFLLHHFNHVRTENDWLRSERTLLRQKLFNISQFLVFQQSQPFSSAWPCNTLTVE